MKKDKVSHFYNIFSKKIINASCDTFSYEEWGIKNFKVFNFYLDYGIDKLNPNTDTKIFKRIMCAEGWSYINIKNNYCFIGTLNIETGKDLLSLVAKENTFKSAFLNIEDLHYCFLEDVDIQEFLKTGTLGNHLFDSHLEKNIELNKLIKELQLLDCSEQIFVFGSIIKGKNSPPDLDIWINATEIPINPETQHKILELVEKYSLRLDPYIETKQNLLAIDSNISTYEFNWIDLQSTDKDHIIRDFKKWGKEAKSGICINNLELLPTTMEELLNHTNKSNQKNKIKFY